MDFERLIVTLETARSVAVHQAVRYQPTRHQRGSVLDPRPDGELDEHTKPGLPQIGPRAAGGRHQIRLVLHTAAFGLTLAWREAETAAR